ncbi:MAG: hypothetical protein INR71_08040 [Terriglobus roseus]|nr:hypothetical protein [Terriglobus roseus]
MYLLVTAVGARKAAWLQELTAASASDDAVQAEASDSMSWSVVRALSQNFFM